MISQAIARSSKDQCELSDADPLCPNLATQYPTGFDTLSYGTQMLDWRRSLSNPNVIFQTPPHLIILGPIYAATGLDPFTILEVAQPLLYGLLAASSYYAARKLLHWEPRQALLAAIILSLQTATLRISWDLLRNVARAHLQGETIYGLRV